MRSTVALVIMALVPASAVRASDSLAVIAVDDCSKELTLGGARLLRAALSGSPEIQAKTEEQMLEALGGPLRGSIEDAERLISSARMDLFADNAKDALHQALQILTALPPSEPRRWEGIRQVVSLQVLLYFLDRRAESEWALERIMRVEPSFDLDHEQFSPEMWGLADKIRERVRRSATSTLEVRTDPSGLPVAVDGRIIGKSPISFKLPPGNYRVEAAFTAERTLARKVHVDGTTTVELTQDFDGAVRVDPGLCLATAKDRGSRLAPLVKLAAFLGVKESVGVWREEPVKGEVYLQTVMVNAATGQEVRAARIKTESGQLRADDIQKMAQFLSAGKAPPPVEPVATAPRPLAPSLKSLVPTAEQTSTRRTWGWSVGLGGVALLGAAVALDLAAASALDSEKAAAAQGNQAAYDSAKASANSRDTAAKVLFIGGAVALGTGAFLLLTGSRPPTPPVAVVPSNGGATVLVSGRLP
jgi:hypothetical protein